MSRDSFVTLRQGKTHTYNIRQGGYEQHVYFLDYGVKKYGDMGIVQELNERSKVILNTHKAKHNM